MYQIKFTLGEKTGEIVPLTHNQTISIGRSHTNDICLKAADVSGKHVIIRSGSGSNLSIEILSSRTTKHNGKSINIGDIVEITAGDTVQLGEGTVFAIERAAEQTVADGDGDNEKTKCTGSIPPENSDNDATRPEAVKTVQQEIKTVIREPETVPQDLSVQEKDSTETLAFQTRIASDDELEKIKKSFRLKQKLKIFLIAVPVMLFFSGAIAFYFYLKPATEEYLSWPTDKNGKFLNDFKQISPYLALVFPKTPGMSVTTNGNTTEVFTKIGKLQDVPLHIVAVNMTDKGTLTRSHGEAFEEWMNATRDKEPSVNWGGNKNTVFVNRSRGAGIPLSTISYTRRVKNDDFFGFSVFLRNAENIHAVMIEVPLQSRWRAENFLRNQADSMVIYAIKRTEDHWEGTSLYRTGTTPEQDLEESVNFMKREAPVYWGKIFYRLRSALIKATLAGNNNAVAEAKSMLIKLREQQTVWYNSQKLSYQYAETNNDTRTMQSIQATCSSIFSAEFQQADYRYDLIRRKDWK
ncbi:MAG: FHA domain-containing protein [Victivallales bacterium]